MKKATMQSIKKYSNINIYAGACYSPHPLYEVKDKKGKVVGVDILILFYGNLWERVLNRIEHQVDGYIHTIKHNCECFKIYRKLESTKDIKDPKLRLIKSSDNNPI
jgi:hypothetical protein